MIQEPNTTPMQPFGVSIDLETGAMHNPTHHIVRRASDMRGYYRDETALEARIRDENDPVLYEVFERPVPEAYGHLMYCISKTYPGKVGSEYIMTKGHYHTVAETAEIYLCLTGEGRMIMKTADGRTAAEEMTRGRMVYVPPCWAHRTVNTGKTPLISFCTYPAEAGHNYGDIEVEGFGVRLLEKDGEPVIEEA